MATDQGKTSNVNGLAAMAALTGRTIDETGTTTYRPPFVPVPMGVIAGRRRGALINPLRRLPLEAEHRADGAQMREYGGWLRPAWYGPDDPELAIQREAARARDTVALFDGSSLGKIEVIGPDAAKLADFHSYNRLSTLKPGKIRYGFLLSEIGHRVRRRRDAAPRRGSLSRLLLVGPHRCGASCGSSSGGRTVSIRAASSFTTRPPNGRRSPSPARARAISSRRCGPRASRSTTRACRTWPSRRPRSTARRSGSRG